MNARKKQLDFQFDYYENARLLTNRDLASCEEVYRYSELKNLELRGMPLSTFREDGELMVAFTRPAHTLIIGATESGKTTGYINPTIQILSELKRKSSMVISDPKGELFSTHYHKLRNAGYEVRVFNLRNPNYSDYWNPLEKIFKSYAYYTELPKKCGVKMVNGVTKYVFLDVAYATREQMLKQLSSMMDLARTSVENEMQGIVDYLLPSQSSKEAYWDDAAREVFLAAMHMFLEQGLASKSVTVHNFSLKNIIEFLTSNDAKKLAEIFNACDKNSKAYKYSSGIRDNAENTRSCIYSILTTNLAHFKNYAIEKITGCSNFSMDELDERPHAVFLITKDEDAGNGKVARLFLARIYETLIRLAERNGGKLKRPFYFVLDEFGNLPRIDNIQNMITAGRSRDIWLLLVVQSFAQIDCIYDSKIREVIRDNTCMHIFFGSNDYYTRKEFSQECGQRTILSPQNFLNAKGGSLERFDFETVSLVPVSKLNEMPDGMCYITRFKKSVLQSTVERSYLCKEFDIRPVTCEDVIAGVDICDPKYAFRGFTSSHTKRIYEKLFPGKPATSDADEDMI